MFQAALLIATFLAALVMGPSLAHALEQPGKMRLDRQQYYAVQTIYYPGFTIGGIAEPLAIVATAVVLVLARGRDGDRLLVAGALVLLILTQLLFWLVVQPVNRQWLQATKLSGAADRFFRTGASRATGDDDWTKLRDRWERGHVARCLTAMLAFGLLLLVMSGLGTSLAG
jgi:hypothetical protein